MFRVCFLFYAFSIASFDCAFIPDLPNADNVGFHVDLEHRNGQFGEGVRDWFKNMRDKVFARDSSSQINIPNPLDLNSKATVKLYKNDDTPEFEQLIIQPGNFFLDLSTLRFNPNKDWGFHIGNWYIIRRSEGGEEDYSRKNIEDWSYWKEFLDSRDKNIRRSWIDDIKEPKANERSYSTTTSRVSELETTMNALNEEKKEASENDTSAMDNLSVEILKPLA